MFSVIFAMLYGAWENRIDDKLLVNLLYFLSAGVLWMILTCLMALFIVWKDGPVANPVFWRMVPLIGFGLGLVFSFFPWITGLRNSGADTEKP